MDLVDAASEGGDSDGDATDGDAPLDDSKPDPWVTKQELARQAEEVQQAIDAELDPESLAPSYVAKKREPPACLVMPLLPYQKEFLSWAIDQELGLLKGGVLAGPLLWGVSCRD